ncbi:MAG TPA: SAM-dependent methyltransferase [Geminicoccaceae bacterium]|nr:SAM-dependent methyltransferase [Geminicoccaceae bacterium]
MSTPRAAPPTESPLAETLRALIRAAGPISVARYMALALGHPEHGYYMRRDPFGAGGDFTTAPEIGQVFGELLGLCCAQWWLDAGRPERLQLIELGPGRGTLMVDALRAVGAVPGCREALDVRLVETSPALRARQRGRLAGDAVSWHEGFEDVPPGPPPVVLANEFFDALPVHQLVRRGDGSWVERRVAFDGDGRLGFVLDAEPSPLARDLPPGCDAAPPGAVTEVGPAREALAAAIAARVAAHNGLALILDFGDAFVGPTGDTLQAVRHHRPWPVLEAPGEADLTAHVDFRALAGAAGRAGADVHGPVAQGRFLTALGIGARTAALLRRATPEQAERLRSAERRLTGPGEMGELFRVLALTPPGAPPPPGFPPEAPPA